MQLDRCIDEGQVRERLRVVPQHLPGPGVHLLAEQAEIVGAAPQLVEQRSRPLDLTQGDEVIGEPVGTDGERPLAACYSVVGTFVALHETLR